MVTRAFARKTLLVLVQLFPSWVVTIVCGSHATLRVFNDGSFLHRSWCSAQVMLEESTGFGFLCCLVDMWRPRCVFMERYASVFGSVSFCCMLLHGAQTDVGNREFLHEYNAVCGKTGVKHHCRTTLNLKSR